MRRRGWDIGVSGFLLFLMFLAWSAGATTVLPLSLKTIVDESEKAFLGSVLSVEQEVEEHGIPAQYVRFKVLEGIKGTQGGETLLIKQFLSKDRYPLGDQAFLVAPKSLRRGGLRFVPGEKLVLFLYPESRYGFTSPVGFGQGAFVVSSQGEKEVVQNSWENLSLKIHDGTMKALSLPEEGAMELKEFLKVVKEMTR